MILKLRLDDLPTSFRNVIVKLNDDMTLIRSNLSNFSDVTKWIEEFSINTHTKWNVRSSVPNGKYIQCKYVLRF